MLSEIGHPTKNERGGLLLRSVKEVAEFIGGGTLFLTGVFAGAVNEKDHEHFGHPLDSMYDESNDIYYTHD